MRGVLRARLKYPYRKNNAAHPYQSARMRGIEIVCMYRFSFTCAGVNPRQPRACNLLGFKVGFFDLFFDKFWFWRWRRPYVSPFSRTGSKIVPHLIRYVNCFSVRLVFYSYHAAKLYPFVHVFNRHTSNFPFHALRVYFVNKPEMLYKLSNCILKRDAGAFHTPGNKTETD